MNRILLLEDDVSLIDGLVYSLKKNEFDVEVARTVCEAKQYLSELDRYDLLILDVTLPDGTGFDVCERVRKEKQQIPIIFLTASDEEVSIIRGLDSGGDDYITKPFKLGELCSRIRALLRRAGVSKSEKNTSMECGDITIDLLGSRATLKGKALDLTSAEYRLLCLLVRNANRVVTRDIILNELWDDTGNFVDDNTLSVYVRRLREKVETNPSHTIWGNSALMVSMVNISSDRIASAFSNFRIAQVSDLHNAEFGESNTELIELLSEHEPDIIVITGDLIDAGHTDIEIAFDFIKQAVQIAPVYFVTGNHEANFSHYDQFKTGLEASGVTVLEDEAIQLVHNNEMITLIGLSDSDFTIKGDMFNEAPAMVNTKLNSLIDDENSYTILLSHRPELFETYVCCGVDLVLCGHAHGGQFRLPFIGGLVAPNQGLFPKYDSGLYTDGKTNMVVSRGLGNSIIPFRFNNRPEVVLVELNTE